MLPDITTRINNLGKALESVIIPAIGEDESFAAEQAALMLGHLKILNEQWDNAYLYEKGSFDNMAALARTLVNLAKGGSHNLTKAQHLAHALTELPCDLPLTVTGVSKLTAQLGQAIDELVRSAYADGSTEFKSAMFKEILNYNHCQSTRERTWFKSNNLDPDVRDLPDMDEMLNSFLYIYKNIED